MMRFTPIVTTLAAALFVVPAATGGGEADTLRAALDETVRALEVLAGIEQRATAGDTGAVAAVRALTEPPLADERERDGTLGRLRDELSLLELRFELLETGAGAAATRGAHDSAHGAPGSGGFTHGLDASLRELLAGIGPGSTPRVRATPAGAPAPGSSERAASAARRAQADADAGAGAVSRSSAPPPRSADAVDPTRGAGPAPRAAAPTATTADPLLQAQACYRAGRYAEGIALLEPIAGSAQTLYWLARCHEKLGTLDEAARLYGRVIEVGGGSTEVDRARTDLEFLTWRRQFRRAEGGR